MHKLKSAQLLRSFAARSDFTEAAVQVVGWPVLLLPARRKPVSMHRVQARLVATTNDYFQQHRGSYVQPGELVHGACHHSAAL